MNASILQKYANFLKGKHPEWEVEIVKRVSSGKCPVWGVVQLTRGKRLVLIRVDPKKGVDRVRFVRERYMRVQQILNKEQLQYRFGYAPVPRPPERRDPYRDLAREASRAGGRKKKKRKAAV
jgi:hypothetical protein